MSSVRRAGVALAAFALAAAGLAVSPQPAAASWERTLTIQFAFGENLGDGSGRVTSDDGGIDCSSSPSGQSGDCSEHYVFPNFSTTYDLTLTFDPATGSVACTNITSGCGTKSATILLPIHFDLGSGGDVLLRPTFSLAWVYVQVTDDGPGSVSSNTFATCTPSGGADHCWNYKYGNSVVLTGNPENGYPFSWWLGSPCEASAGHDATCTFSANDVNLTAVFGLASITIRRTTGGSICEADKTLCLQEGQTSLRAYRMAGGSQTFDAVPDTGYVFDHWNTGPCSGKPSRCTFTLSGSVELTATFRKPATPAPTASATAKPTSKPTTAPGSTSTPAPATTSAPTAGPTGPATSTTEPQITPAPSPAPDGTANDIPSFAPPESVAASPQPAVDPVVDPTTGGSTPGLPLILTLFVIAALVVVGLGFAIGRRSRAQTIREG